jgi:hypothetical protein
VYIPEAPELGMVLSYSYLWSSQHDRGETSGRKDRPAAIVVIRTDLGPDKIVYVVPITHSPPADHDPTKILIPRQIKQRLGLDEEPSWVDISEYNAFAWSNVADLRPTKQTLHAKPVEQTCLYGYLPKRFFAQLRQALNEYRLSNKARLTPR